MDGKSIDIIIPGQTAKQEGSRIETLFDGRIRDRVAADVSIECVDIRKPDDGMRKIEGEGSSYVPPARANYKGVPGRAVADIQEAVIKNDGFIAPVRTNDLEPLGINKLQSSTTLIAELLTKGVYKIKPIQSLDLRILMHVTSSQITRAVAVGIGHTGISDPADRVENRDKIVYGGELTLLFEPVPLSNITLYQNSGTVGNRRWQTVGFQTYSGTGLTVPEGTSIVLPGFEGSPFTQPSFFLLRNPSLDHHAAAPFWLQSLGTSVDAITGKRANRIRR